MLTATPSSGPPTFVAVNGVLSAPGSGTQLNTNPTPVFTVPANFGASGFIPNSNFTPTPFVLPSTNFPQSANLACATPPFPASQFQSSLFPFFNSPGTSLLSGSPSIAMSPFGTALPQFLQPPSSTGQFPNSIAGNPVASPANGQAILSETKISANSVVSGTFSGHPFMLPIPSLAGSHNPLMKNGDFVTFPIGVHGMSASSLGSVSLPSSMVNVSASCTSPVITTSTTAPPLTVTSSLASSVQSSEPVSISPSLQNSFKIDKTRPVAPSSVQSTSRASSSNNLLSLESVDFHREDILDIIDRLRERKARPDFERISYMLKRHRNINPDQTQLCLGRLAASGAVVCVDYKGNISYRNPSKWRKTFINLGTTNPPAVSQRLTDAVRLLMTGKPEIDSATGFTFPAPPGPNGGYSVFQIERALQAIKADPVTTTKTVPDLTGATLRVYLDRESTNGKLAKTPDGRYVLDETGERKKLAGISNGIVPSLSNKKPLPPNGSPLLLPNTLQQRHGRASAVTCIAPADFSTRPLLAKQTLSQGLKPIGIPPLLSASGRSALSRRGRPPGSKGRRTPLDSSPSEKKLKLDSPLTSIISTSSADTASVSTSVCQLPFSSIHNGVGILNSKPILTSPFISIPQSGFNPMLSLPTPFISGSGCATNILPNPLFSPAFSTSQSNEVPFSSAFGGHLVSFSTALNPLHTTGIHPTFVPTPSTVSQPLYTKPDDSPVITLLANLGTADTEADLKSEHDNENVCVHCGMQPTSDEQFLICKECNTRAHPTCLDYWPELTERARQSEWQCAQCKTCGVCQDTQSNGELLVCDACDKGFHPSCHTPKVQEPVDRSLPWVCSGCRNEGYSVAIGTMSNETLDNAPSGTEERENIARSDEEDVEVNVTEVEEENDDEATPLKVADVPTGRNDSTTPCSTSQEQKATDGHTENPISNQDAQRDEVSSQENKECQDTDPILSRDRHENEERLSSQDVREVETTDNSASDRPSSTADRPTDVVSWSVDQVRDWLLEGGFTRESEAFHQQEIDGACLLLMKRMDVLTELGIKLGPAVKIYERIKRLQSGCSSPTGS